MDECPRLPTGVGARSARRLEKANAICDGALAILAALPAEFGREVVVRHRQAPESRESSARAADFRHSHSTCLAPASGYLSKKRCADRDLRSVERRCLYLVSLLFLPPHLQGSKKGERRDRKSTRLNSRH